MKINKKGDINLENIVKWILILGIFVLAAIGVSILLKRMLTI